MSHPKYFWVPAWELDRATATVPSYGPKDVVPGRTGSWDGTRQKLPASPVVSWASELGTPTTSLGLPRQLSSKESAGQCKRPGRHGFNPSREDLLEEEMATHSSTLAWEIPWTEEPDRGDWWATVPGVVESDVTQRVHNNNDTSLPSAPAGKELEGGRGRCCRPCQGREWRA